MIIMIMMTITPADQVESENNDYEHDDYLIII